MLKHNRTVTIAEFMPWRSSLPYSITRTQPASNLSTRENIWPPVWRKTWLLRSPQQHDHGSTQSCARFNVTMWYDIFLTTNKPKKTPNSKISSLFYWKSCYRLSVQRNLQMVPLPYVIGRWRAHLKMGAPSTDRLLVLRDLQIAQIGRWRLTYISHI